VYLEYTDPQGNVLAEADVQGHIVARYDYRPYGGVVNGSGPNGPGYTGHVQDPETGLVYMQARYYQARGQFLSPDPVGPSPGNIFSFNRYAYANNNPIRNTDPDGRSVLLALAGVLYETGSFVSGNGFHGSRIAGALVDGYNGEGAGVKGALVQDAGIVLTVATLGAAGPEAAGAEGTTEVIAGGETEAAAGEATEASETAGSYRPSRSLPRDEHGNAVPDSDAPHTQLGTKSGRNGDYTQAREWGRDENGKLVPKRDIDFTDHGRPQNHPNPHQHRWIPNPTGGTPQRGPTEPFEYP
jgi:RHS repeat-associated protein